MRRAGSGNFWSNLFHYAGNGGASGLATDVASARTALGLGSLAVKNTVATADIDNDAVTFAKIQNLNTARLLGRTTAAAGDAEEISAGYGLSLASLALGVSLQSALFQDQRAQNTNGGTAVANTWTARAINTSVFNTITGASIAGNTLTLATAGTYLFIANGIFMNVGGAFARHRFENTSDATTVAMGPNSSPSGLTAPFASIAFGAVTTAVSKNFQLQYYVKTPNSTTDLGSPMNVAGEVEVYVSWLVARLA
jgi:hypothetical protein